MNMGPEDRQPSRQIGSASLSPAASSKFKLEAAVAGLLKIQKAHPEYDAALHAAIQVMTDQDFTIDFLSAALADVRSQLKALLVDLDLDAEVQGAIDIIQGGILTIFDMLELDSGVLQRGGGAAASSASSSSSTPPSSSLLSSSTTTRTTTREKNAAELKSSLTKVYRLMNRGKTGSSTSHEGAGGFIDVAHQHVLPSGPLNTDTGKEWTLRDATVQDLIEISVPVFPELKDVTEDADGCGSQFQGQTNAGRVARSASSAIGVRRKSVISIAGHGKNHSDHQGYTMDKNLKELTLSSEAPVLSGSRSFVLALAQHRPEPTQTHESKHSPWAPRDVVYAFYD
jgi:hypothetical protein